MGVRCLWLNNKLRNQKSKILEIPLSSKIAVLKDYIKRSCESVNRAGRSGLAKLLICDANLEQ